MTLFRAGLVLLVAALLVMTPPVATAAAPCVDLEAQNWWTDAGKTDADAQHIHLSTCFPAARTGAVLSGTVPLDVRVQLHNNPGKTYYVAVHDSQMVMSNIVPLAIGPCMQCESTVRLNVDSTKRGDGNRQWKIHVDTHSPDHRDAGVSTTWTVLVKNTTRISPAVKDWLEAKSWIPNSGFHYTSAALRSPVPIAPVSGNWAFNWRTAAYSNAGPITSHAVYLDSAFHATPMSYGTIVKQGSGGFSGTTTIDTTKLSNGPHRLLLRADQKATAGTATGIQVVSFVVRN